MSNTQKTLTFYLIKASIYTSCGTFFEEAPIRIHFKNSIPAEVIYQGKIYKYAKEKVIDSETKETAYTMRRNLEDNYEMIWVTKDGEKVIIDY